MNQKDNFLDKNSLIAIVLLGFCWVLWDSHMKKKYPPNPSKSLKQKTVAPSPKKINTQQLLFKERFYKFSGEKMEITFSSKGFGVSQLRLKEYFDRNKRPILFKSFDQPLFATQFLQNTEGIPFKIQKKGSTYKGVFKTKDIHLVKTIEIDEENFLLKTQIEFFKRSPAVKGLRTVFEQALLDEKKQNFFLEMLTAYGKDRFKGFVFFGGKRNLFTKEDLKEKKSYPYFSVGALGGKYFGSAFLNQSSLLPTMIVEKKERHILAKVDYAFLNDKPLTLKYLSFVGPKSSKYLKTLGPEARSWIDFGFFSWLAHPLLAALKLFYKITYNWGIAIVLLTLFVRLCLLPINIKSYRSMKAMQGLQPQIQKIKNDLKKDPKKMNLAIMALMKENKASPLQGCLPLLLQTPVFFALYRVLGESIELYQTPFILWIKDLSFKDPYYVLPVLAGLTLFVQQKITPMNVPPAQARILSFMPIIFSVFMLSLPSGLTLYIFISGLFGLVQQAFFIKLKQK